VVAQFDSAGRIARLRPDEDTPMGILCRLGEHAADIVYSPNRLLHPMRRKGKKGTYDFERISWDDAYDEVAGKLEVQKQAYGPEAAAIYTGVGSFEQSLCDIFQPEGVAVSSASSVLFPYGSPNTLGVGALCYVAYGMIAPHLCTGKMLVDMFNDMDNSEMVVVWGTNPSTDLPPIEMKRLVAASKRGASVVVIDPRRIQAARLSGAEWIPIRPGTDGALALGMCNVLIAEELCDENFVTDWTHGFEDFSRYVQHFRPEVVEGITGVPASTLVALARRIAGARGVSQLMYTGLEYSNSGVQSIRASLVLWALAGQLDAPGGRCFTMPGNKFPINRDGLIRNPDTGVRLGGDRFPVYIKYRDEAHAIALPESVLEGKPYKVRSLIIQGGSVITSWPDTELWQKTLGSLDFLVCIDRQLTADAAYADIVLPASTYFESRSYVTYGPLFKIREPLIEPLGESRGDYQIMSELARRLGYGHLYPQGDVELLRHVLKGSGFSYEEVIDSGGMVSVETGMMEYKKWEKGLLRADGKPGFDTPTGKFEIHSGVLEEYGYDPLPKYIEPVEGPLSMPDALERYPLVFNSGSRSSSSFHTQHIGNAGLNKKRPEPAVMVNTHDALERGIMDGQRVRISTSRGSVVMRAYVTGDIMRGAIDANHAGGGPLGPDPWQKANVNRLTDLDQYDPISGFPVYKCLLCQVEPADNSLAPVNMDHEDDLQLSHYIQGQQKQAREVYLDNNATTRLAPEVMEFMADIAQNYGNSSSIHATGRMARKLLDSARLKVATQLGTTARRLVFTGGGTEANNLAIKGAFFARGLKGSHAITSSIEHPSVLMTFGWLERMGVEVTYLPVDSTGMVSVEDMQKHLRPNTELVSIMYANNETGTIQPVAEIAELAHEAGALMHTDAVQCFGKIPVNVGELGVDLLSVSAHKLHGPKGTGALYVARGVHIESLVHGGGQEYGLRSGTENISGCAGFGRAVELIPKHINEFAKVAELRDRLQRGIQELVPELMLNGSPDKRLPNTLNVTLPDYRGESIVLALDSFGVRLSSGSACKSGSSDPSHAIIAMGRTEQEAHCSLRFSLNHETSVEDIQYTLSSLKNVLTGSRKNIHFIPCR